MMWQDLKEEASITETVNLLNCLQVTIPSHGEVAEICDSGNTLLQEVKLEFGGG